METNFVYIAALFNAFYLWVEAWGQVRIDDDEDGQQREQRSIYQKDYAAGQLKEFQCALSLYGRVHVYGLRYMGSVLQRRARLVCYDHGWWRAPVQTWGACALSYGASIYGRIRTL